MRSRRDVRSRRCGRPRARSTAGTGSVSRPGRSAWRSTPPGPLGLRTVPDERPLRLVDTASAPEVVGPMHARMLSARAGRPGPRPGVVGAVDPAVHRTGGPRLHRAAGRRPPGRLRRVPHPRGRDGQGRRPRRRDAGGGGRAVAVPGVDRPDPARPGAQPSRWTICCRTWPPTRTMLPSGRLRGAVAPAGRRARRAARAVLGRGGRVCPGGARRAAPGERGPLAPHHRRRPVLRTDGRAAGPDAVGLRPRRRLPRRHARGSRSPASARSPRALRERPPGWTPPSPSRWPRT